MNKRLYPPAGNFQPERVEVDLQFTSGASGAVPTTFLKKSGISGVTRDNTGLYSATLDEGFVAFVNGWGGVLPTGGAFASTIAQEVVVFAASTSTKVIKFATVRSDTGVAIDMASGDVLFATFVIQRDTCGIV
jgi:hypothetical protein